MTVLEALLRGIRTHEGTLLRARLGRGEEYAVPVRAPLVFVGLVTGELTVEGRPLPPGGVVMLQPGHPVPVTAGGAGASVMVWGYRARAGGVRLTSALPGVAVVAPDGPDCVTLLELLDRQIGGDGPSVVRDRLLDWLLTCTLHAWFGARAAERPGWFAALADPVVGPALAALHDEPAHRWTVEELAARGGSGRAAFARRFRALVGCAPLTYLREWRMTLAAEYLADPATTVAAVARRVGYADAFAFSAAFKRERAVAPSAVRG
ncbi:helix-turn-helix domain-containing protein [Pseudonocardia nigra]|uniref:helix-turn-helix domain-containing protein n=1 Tax=Pseudonocardia nigra TaxID=1921578 RepID=UPI001C5EA9AE|nr:AraC family transcriptional regulator [Pseudonocardia nigra]